MTSPPAEPIEPSPIDRRLLVRDAIRYTSVLGGLSCAVLAIAGDLSLAIAVAIGTLFGELNFVLLARGVAGAIDRTVAGIVRVQGPDPSLGVEPEDVLGRPLGAGGPVRLALSVLLVAALLWFVPTNPAGLAMGIVISLFGASVAALRHNSRNP